MAARKLAEGGVNVDQEQVPLQIVRVQRGCPFQALHSGRAVNHLRLSQAKTAGFLGREVFSQMPVDQRSQPRIGSAEPLVQAQETLPIMAVVVQVGQGAMGEHLFEAIAGAAKNGVSKGHGVVFLIRF